MLINKLEITDVRNLRNVCLEDLFPINILYGSNGSGKTSVLESIHLLSSARSFRSHKLKPLINNEVDNCVCFGQVAIDGLGYQSVGVQRFRSPSLPGIIKVSGQPVRSASILAENLPLQVISSDTFKLLEGSPSIRRQFLDWGVFHVEHRFHVAWKSLQRCLKQRNTLLRRDRIDLEQLAIWSTELAGLAEEIDDYRAVYFKQLVPIFNQLLCRLVKLEGFELGYYRGWDTELSLVDVLKANQFRELEKKYTISGPHRADLRFRYQSCHAADILSRGQQKLVICALRIAQGYLLSQLTNKGCVFLIDDLPAELDKEHRKSLCTLLEALDCQVFITCVDHEDMVDCWSDDVKIKMFHVEHGNVSAVNS